ncbi:MAG: hypothetical protein PHS14_13525 [Elusimicrobia bacterium]|nr:hypothetical protein [Elusimicrobiota bacterium]
MSEENEDEARKPPPETEWQAVKRAFRAGTAVFFVTAAGFFFMAMAVSRPNVFHYRSSDQRQQDFIGASVIILGFAALAGLVAGLIAYSTGLSASDDPVYGPGGPDYNPPEDKDDS